MAAGTRSDISVIRAGQAPCFDLEGVEFIGGAAPSRASDQLCTWTILVGGGYDSGQAHTLDRDEVFTVVDGSVRLQADGPDLEPGDTAVVPAGVPIRLANAARKPARVHVAIVAGFTAAMADGSAIGTPPWAR